MHRTQGTASAVAVLWLVAACHPSEPMQVTSDATAGTVDARIPPPQPDAAEPTGRIFIAEDQPQPQDVVVDDAYVYWVNDPVDAECLEAVGSLHRRRKDASAPIEELAVGLHHPHKLVADDDYIYVLEYGCAPVSDGKLMRIPKAGGMQEVLANGLIAPIDVDVDVDYAYWTESRILSEGGGFVTRVPKAGGATEILAAEQDAPNALRVRDNYAYWMTGRDSGVWRMPTSGGSRESLADWPYIRSWHLVVDDKKVFWIQCEGAPPPCELSIWSAELDSGVRSEVAEATAQRYTGALVGEGQFLYVGSEDGAIRRIPKVGGAPLWVWGGGGFAKGIALDERFVYWASHEPGFVAKIRKLD